MADVAVAAVDAVEDVAEDVVVTTPEEAEMMTTMTLETGAEREIETGLMTESTMIERPRRERCIVICKLLHILTIV